MAVKDGDGVYGIPYVVEGYGIIYNEEIMDKYFALDGAKAASMEEINKGNALYDNKQFTMALDAYICALGRYDANYSEASEYGAQAEYDVLASQAEAQIAEKFGVNAKDAREIYGLEDRIYNIVKALGLNDK